MLQARYTNTKLKDEEIKAYANDISITPLSIPILCGPWCNCKWNNSDR